MADVSGFFGRLIKAAEAQKDDKGNTKSWWRWPLIILLILLAVTVFAWISRRNAQELAKLRHEKKKREIEAAQLESDKKVEAERDKIDKHQAKIDKAAERIEEIDARIKRVEERLADETAAIDRIRTWDDVGPADQG